MRWAWSGVAAGLGRRSVRIDGPSRGLVRVYSAEEPDWEAMYRSGGGSSYAADWESGADDGDASTAVADWAITAVSVSESAVRRDPEAWASCRRRLEALDLRVAVGGTPADAIADGGDGDVWCRVGPSFREDVLGATALGMRAVYYKGEDDGEDDEDDEDEAIFDGRQPPPEGSVMTFTAMGSKNYCRDAMVAEFADAVAASFADVASLAESWQPSTDAADATDAAEAAAPTVEALVGRVIGEKYWPVFEQEEILDLETLALLSDSDLKDLGLPLGPRTKLRAYLDSS